ncbi:hypothetical protein CHU32_01950 [Superficieibacter electus]|uniref:Uncharacterized protein n=1 Tax=Superficieibacter electus TaxID=2022662 RepID=A0A2P5GWM8_9ENTR|nr:hypothetical protein CHU33_01945 [Superficieibacter electus]POP50976.1 hypothetical protein CHU32_01950 [Superficieibacter electus]
MVLSVNHFSSIAPSSLAEKVNKLYARKSPLAVITVTKIALSKSLYQKCDSAIKSQSLPEIASKMRLSGVY